MSCVVDLAELFGDETIEVIDTGGSKSLDIPETTIIFNSPFECCGTPKIIDMVASQLEYECEYEYEAHQTSDIEAGSDTESRLDPEYDSDEEEKKSIDPGLEQPPGCCSSVFFHHVDVRAQAESRKVELEDLRQRSLAKPKAARLDNASAPSELADFFDKQREMNLEQREKQRDAMEFLHRYRADEQLGLGDLRRTVSKDSESSYRRSTDSAWASAPANATTTESPLAQSWKEEGAKPYEQLHSFRYQEPLMFCSTAESGDASSKELSIAPTSDSMMAGKTGSVSQDSDGHPDSNFQAIRNEFEERLKEAVGSPLPDAPTTNEATIDSGIQTFHIMIKKSQVSSEPRKLEVSDIRAQPIQAPLTASPQTDYSERGTSGDISGNALQVPDISRDVDDTTVKIDSLPEREKYISSQDEICSTLAQGERDTGSLKDSPDAPADITLLPESEQTGIDCVQDCGSHAKEDIGNATADGPLLKRLGYNLHDAPSAGDSPSERTEEDASKNLEVLACSMHSEHVPTDSIDESDEREEEQKIGVECCVLPESEQTGIDYVQDCRSHAKEDIGKSTADGPLLQKRSGDNLHEAPSAGDSPLLPESEQTGIDCVQDCGSHAKEDIGNATADGPLLKRSGDNLHEAPSAGDSPSERTDEDASKNLEVVACSMHTEYVPTDSINESDKNEDEQKIGVECWQQTQSDEASVCDSKPSTLEEEEEQEIIFFAIEEDEMITTDPGLEDKQEAQIDTPSSSLDSEVYEKYLNENYESDQNQANLVSPIEDSEICCEYNQNDTRRTTEVGQDCGQQDQIDKASDLSESKRTTKNPEGASKGVGEREEADTAGRQCLQNETVLVIDSPGSESSILSRILSSILQEKEHAAPLAKVQQPENGIPSKTNSILDSMLSTEMTGNKSREMIMEGRLSCLNVNITSFDGEASPSDDNSAKACNMESPDDVEVSVSEHAMCCTPDATCLKQKDSFETKLSSSKVALKNESPVHLTMIQTELLAKKSLTANKGRRSNIVLPKNKMSLVNTSKASLSVTPVRRPATKLLLPHLPKSAAKSLSSTKGSEPTTPTSARKATLKYVPLYARRPTIKVTKKEPGPICSLKYTPNLHKSLAACERCLHWASQEEREKFASAGHHLRIMKVRGGCDRGCAIFPRECDEFQVRLCKKCFYDTHKKAPKQKDIHDDIYGKEGV